MAVKLLPDLEIMAEPWNWLIVAGALFLFTFALAIVFQPRAGDN